MVAATTPGLKKVLIAEGGSHYKILEQIYHLLKDKCDLVFLINHQKRYDYRELFPSAAETTVVLCPLQGILFFFMLIVLGRSYDVINISTGPDGSHWTEFFRVPCFYICCLLDGHKIVLSIRNTAPYTSSTPGVLAWIRSRSVKHVRRFSFESATQRDAFPAATGITDARLGVSYDRYPDLGRASGTGDAALPHGIVRRVGLSGSLNMPSAGTTLRRKFVDGSTSSAAGSFLSNSSVPPCPMGQKSVRSRSRRAGIGACLVPRVQPRG